MPGLTAELIAIDEYDRIEDCAIVATTADPLAPGDYVLTANLSQAQYEYVASAFMQLRGHGPTAFDEGPEYNHWRNYRAYAWVATNDSLLNLQIDEDVHRRERTLRDLEILTGRPAPQQDEAQPREPEPVTRNPEPPVIHFDPTQLRKEELITARDQQHRTIRNYRRDLAYLRETIKEHEQWIAMNEEWQNLPETALSEALRNYIRDKAFSPGDVLYRTNEHHRLVTQLADTERNIRHAANLLLNHSREHARLRGNPLTFTVEGMDVELQNIPQYVPGSVRIDAAEHTISWVLTGVLMQPDNNPYRWLNGGTIPTIRLPDTRVILRFQDNGAVNVYLKFPTDESPRCAPTGYAGHGTPHPHVLNRYAPCLGDFEGAVTNAAQSGDLRTANDILLAFLGQAYNADSAGMEWWRWALTDWDSPEEYPWFEVGDHRGNEDYFWDSSSGKNLNARLDAEGNLTLNWVEHTGGNRGFDQLCGSERCDHSEDEYQDDDGDIRCNHCDALTWGEGRYHGDCDCCEDCQNEHCTCCGICDGTDRDECGCCTNCENVEGECTCCPICDTSDRDECGCCQECGDTDADTCGCHTSENE